MPSPLPSSSTLEVPTHAADTPDRFAFGRNWASFLKVLNDNRIREAERSLREMLGVDGVNGKTWLDIGSGSGLFSLAAMRLGARQVHSFDYDPQSVACTQELRRRYFPTASNWTVEQGSVLDHGYLERLGTWDVVYSWGVLHHTGRMWTAIDNAASRVKPGGTFFIAIYNDQGHVSRGWSAVKRAYNSGSLGRGLTVSTFVPYFAVRGVLVDLVRRKDPRARYREYQQVRGMSLYHDWIDWLGGYPFEVAKPEEVFEFCQLRGFTLTKLSTCGGRLGCNQFVLLKGIR